MSVLVLTLATVSGALVPVEFEARPYHTVVMKDKKVYKGLLFSQPGAATLKLQVGGRQRLLPGDQVEEIVPPVSLEEAHDLVAANISPDDVHSWYAIALECMKKRPPLLKEATADLRKAIAAKETHAPSHLALVRVLLRTGDTTGARQAADRFQKAVPHDAGAHFITGEVLTVLGEDPREAYRKAIELKPTVEAYLGLARAHMSRGAFEEAEAALGSAQLISPFSTEIDAARGELALARGKLERAENLYAAALGRVRPGDGSAGANSARIGLASVYYLQGRLEDATKALLDADPTDVRVTYILGLVKLAEEESAGARDTPATTAVAVRAEGEEAAPPPESQRLFALAAEDGFARGYLGLATQAYLASGGDLSAGWPHLEQAAKADRGDAYAALLAAWFKSQLGRTSEAIADYTRVTVLAPNFAGGHGGLAAATLSEGSAVEAVRFYRAGIESCPGDPGLLAGLGLAQVAAGDVTSARRSLEAASRAGYRGADLYLAFGFLAHLEQDNASAAEWYTWALTAASASRTAAAAKKYVEASLPRLYGELGLKPAVFTFDQDGEVGDPFGVEARAGAGVSTEGGRLVISGTQETDDGRRTNAVLPVDGGLFRSASADFELDGLDATTAGLRLASHTGAVEIARVPQASIRVRFRDGQKAPFEEWRELMEWPAPAGDGTGRLVRSPSSTRPGRVVRSPSSTRPGRARFTISMLETGKNLARIELRAQAAPPGHGETPATRVIELHKAFWRERAFSVVLFAVSPKDEEVRAVVDNLVVVEQVR